MKKILKLVKINTLIIVLFLINWLNVQNENQQWNISLKNFWFEIQDYFFKFDKNWKFKPSYEVYQTCSLIKNWEIEHFRQVANSVALSITENEKEIAKAKIRCWFLNPLNQLINFILLMIFLHSIFLFVLKLPNIANLSTGDNNSSNFWEQTMTRKQFLKKYLGIPLIYFWFISGLFAVLLIPIEVIFHMLFNNGTFIFKEVFNGFIDILKNAG